MMEQIPFEIEMLRTDLEIGVRGKPFGGLVTISKQEHLAGITEDTDFVIISTDWVGLCACVCLRWRSRRPVST